MTLINEMAKYREAGLCESVRKMEEAEGATDVRSRWGEIGLCNQGGLMNA